MTLVFLGLGSNLGNSIDTINTAYTKIEEKIGKILKKSSIYETIALTKDNEIQNNYFNSVISIDTNLEPLELLSKINIIETEMGRVRSRTWEPRIIDIDILYYGDIIFKSEKLTIPHPEIQNRDFVLVPYNELILGEIKDSNKIIRRLSSS